MSNQYGPIDNSCVRPDFSPGWAIASPVQWWEEVSHPMVKKLATKCVYSRGGFSSERFFKIERPYVTHTGIADISHMWDFNGVPLEKEELPLGKECLGYIKVLALHILPPDEYRVRFPDGETAVLKLKDLRTRPTRD